MSDQNVPDSLPSSKKQPQTDGDHARDVEITLPPAAQDNDLIEKEWVEKAKQIVEHTRDNPYEQQRALAEMKADYMKKRYNKQSETGGNK